MTTDSDSAADSEQNRKGQHPADAKVALLVLGMHRSGTSALTRVLNLLGCSLPRRIMGGSETNPAGHWEPQTIVDLNDEILDAAGSAWNDWQKLHPGWETSPARSGFMRKAARTLQAEYDDTSFFVLKDPRICRIAPFWLDVLQQGGIEPRIIIPVRNPLEVAASLHARDGIDASVGYLIWLRHILDAERSTRGCKRVFTTYSGLLDDWHKVTGRIAEKLELSWPRYSPRVTLEIEIFLDKSLRHHTRNDLGTLHGSAVPAWVRQAYDVILRWSEEAENTDDFADLDAISNELDAAAAAFATPMALFQLATTRLRDADGHISAADGERDAAISRADAAERFLHERSAEVERLASQLAEQEGQSHSFRHELDLATERADAAERFLHERSAEVERLASQLAEQEGQSHSFRHELDLATQRADAAERMLQERSAEVERLASQLAEQEGQSHSFRHELDLATQRADAAERMLREQSAERDVLLARLKAAEVGQTELRMALEAAQKAQLSAEQDLIDHRQEHDAVTTKLAETGSELLQRKEELRQVWADLCAEQDRAEALQAECDSYKQEQARQQRLIERQLDEGRERVRALEAAQKELASVRTALAEARKSLDQANQENTDGKARLEAVEAELEKTHAAARMAVSQRSQTFNEIAIVTQLLRDSELEISNRTETTQWLSQVYAIMLRRPRWWVFLSRKEQFKRLRRRVELRGMFDPESYLAKNPDVAATGADPLLHYITHGIKESRQR